MIPENPYASPGSPIDEARFPQDSVDLFVETLPPPILRAASGVLIVMGITMLVLCLRMALALVANGTGLVVECVHVALGLACFTVAWGIREGHTWLVFVGCALSPAAFVASVFALLTGSIAGLLGAALALANVGLLGASFASVRTIGRARAALAASAALAERESRRVDDTGP